VLDEAGIRFPFCSDLNLSFREAQLRISARGPTRRFERGRRNARNRRILVIAGRSGEGLLTEPTTAAQPWQREPLLMPLSGHCPSARSTASLGGYLLLAPGVSTVRYPIPQRTFKYVATVQSVTDETCRNRILLVDPTLIDPEMQDCNPVSLNRNNRASFLH
jgi:hypothetical protein